MNQFEKRRQRRDSARRTKTIAAFANLSGKFAAMCRSRRRLSWLKWTKSPIAEEAARKLVDKYVFLYRAVRLKEREP